MKERLQLYDAGGCRLETDDRGQAGVNRRLQQERHQRPELSALTMAVPRLTPIIRGVDKSGRRK